MKIGIMVHSKTGNTLSVAEKLKTKLAAKGHSVTIERVSPTDEEEIMLNDVRLKNSPNIDAYDGIVFAGSVRAFSLSPAMAVYLKQPFKLRGKKVACLLTQAFYFSWMGGNNAMNTMQKSITNNGGVVEASGIIHWMSAKRESQIEVLTDTISQAF